MAICAVCGKESELCESARIDGVKQPRTCKNCLLDFMRTGKMEVDDNYWILQMTQLNDNESLDIITKTGLPE